MASQSVGRAGIEAQTPEEWRIIGTEGMMVLPERAGVSGRHAVKHAASGRPYRRVVSDAFSL